jgi:hypothetical protein
LSSAAIGRFVAVSRQTVHKVLFGYRRSRKVESEISRILGKKDWNAVVMEARSAVKEGGDANVKLRNPASGRKNK